MNYSTVDIFFSINENFTIEYDYWNKKDRNGYFILGETSSAFESIGLSKQNIVIDKSKLIQIKNKHFEMSDEIIKKIPNVLRKPLLILKSQSVNNRIVVFGNLIDNNNHPIMIAMELNPWENNNNVKKIYKVASAYGKNNINSINKWLMNKDNILYLDKKIKNNKLLSEIGFNLPIKSNIMIKDIPSDERPRERAIKYGIESLSNEELISIILKTGTKDYNVKVLASKILSSIKDIYDLKNVTISSLTKINGIGSVKAIELLSSLELGKRVYYNKDKNNIKLNNSKKIFEYFKDLFINEKQENFYAIYLDSKSKLLSYKLLFKGTINTSCVHPREVFKYAFLESAYSIIVMHNHPSGDPTPSMQDKEVTEALFKIGKTMAIPVIDHIVFGKNEYFSFYEYINMDKNNI